jgi:bifunctional polynucleotide phosphatase/kinase
MDNIARALDCPFVVFAALSRDGFRKPGRRIWDEAIVPAYLAAGGQASDLIADNGSPHPAAAFFVGDAAGRVGDHADTDRKWALNIGIPFQTPEQYFLNRKPQPYSLSGWRPMLNMTEEENDILPANFFGKANEDKLDLVLFVGPPAAGKTSFYRNHFAGRDYAWVNQDTLGSAAKCQAAVRKHLEQGRSVVVDNTNRNAATRRHYLDLAHGMANVRVRCIYFDVPKDLCRHNNFYRVRAGLQPVNEPRHLLPEMAFSSYFNSVEPPKRQEGFDADIIVVRWVFQGSELEKQRWLLQWD